MTVTEAVSTRRSIRAFTARPVARDLLRKILVRAALAPSGGNLQPWHVHVVLGEKLAALNDLMANRVAALPRGEESEYPVYPAELGEPYRTRRFAAGEAMYARLGIPRHDRARRLQWLAGNFRFFGAPAGLFICVDRSAGAAQWSDLGMYLQTAMLLLKEAGLDSCAQESWSLYHSTVTQFLGVPSEQMLFCGMAIGYADSDHPVNDIVPVRAVPEEYLVFHA